MIDEMDKFRSSQPITANAFTQQRENKLNIEFEKQRTDLLSQINPKKPPEINFSDNLDEPFGSEIDAMLEETIKKRELELQMMPPPPSKNKNIKIGEDISQIDSSETIELNKSDLKRVSFKEPDYESIPASTHKIENNMNNFFLKLKNNNISETQQNNTNHIEEQLKIMDNKLNTIIELLNTK